MLAFLLSAFALSFAVGDSTFGQLLLTYYTGVGEDTLGSGGVNALAMAFFDPLPLATSNNCDFTDMNTPCIRATPGGGNYTMGWAVNVINQTVSMLSGNTAPTRNGKPTIFFSFGGANDGGAPWDQIFGSSSQAQQFATNCAKLVTTVASMSFPKAAFFGIDLDIEGTSTTLPNFVDFAKVFRSSADFNKYPLQMCALSGLASTGSSDYFKVGIMQKYGPTGTDTKAINFLNMMVNNQDSSCSDMSTFWRDPTLNFIPAGNKVCGVWGENLPPWIIHDPGCDDGSDPLFPWMKTNGVGIGIWQWWLGSTTGITNVINQIRQG